MARTYETEIEELLYETLTGDDALATLLGGDETDPRIYLSWRAQDRPRISGALPGYVVMQYDSAEIPVRLSASIEDRRERYFLSFFSPPEAGELRGEVTARFRELFHRQSFVTESFFVYDVGEVGREESSATDRLLEHRYILSCGFLSR